MTRATDVAVAAGGFRSLSPPARLLVVNSFGISVGFYMVLPFLAVYLRDDLGYRAAVVGLVLGLRTLSQQGVFPVGGVLADRIGCRPMIIAGCSLRVVAFGSFAVFRKPNGSPGPPPRSASCSSSRR